METWQIVNGILDSQWFGYLVIFGIAALFYKLYAPKLAQLLQKPQKSQEGIAEKVGQYVVFIRDGDQLTEARGRLTREGFLLADKRAWPLEDARPYLLKKTMGTKPCYIVDGQKQVFYRFPVNVANDKQRDIAGYASNPYLLKRFTDSQIIQKMTQAKTDKSIMVTMLIMGMMVMFLLQSFFMQ